MGAVFSPTLAGLGGTIDNTQHGVRTLANAHAHGALSGVTADAHHKRTEAKETAGAASGESVTWTTAFGVVPIVVVSAVRDATQSIDAHLTARSTTGATAYSYNAADAELASVKTLIAQEAT